MKKFRNLVIGGIESKVLLLLLLTVVILIAAFSIVTLTQTKNLASLANETSEKQETAITGITAEVMDQVVRQSMSRTTELQALISDQALFSDLEDRVEMLCDYAQKLFEDPDSAPEAEAHAPDPAMHGTASVQLFLAPYVETDENGEVADEALRKRISVAANMGDMMISLFNASEQANSCFIGLPEGVFLIADDRAGLKFDGDTLKTYDAPSRFWFTQAAEERGLIFTDVEPDAFSDDIGIVCAKPVYVNGELVAVIGSDLFLTSMQSAVQTSSNDGSMLCVVNRNGHVVFSPASEGTFAVYGSERALDLRQNENAALAALVSDALVGQTDVRLMSVDGVEYYASGAPISTVGWALISLFDSQRLSEPVDLLRDSYQQIQQEAVENYRAKAASLRTTVIIVLAAIMVLAIINAIVLGKKIVKPLNTITRRISELREGNLEFKMEPAFKTGDEIQVLAESFADISHKTVQYVDEVKRVTAEKERIGTELQMATQIQESMLPTIFPPFPGRREFDIFASMNPAREVGGDFYDFYLIDDDHLCMVMADVSGKGVPAALFMMASKIILQSCAMLGSSVSEILTKTNEAICSNNKMEMFITVWLGILEISTGRLVAGNAGHEYPATMRADGSFKLLKDKHDIALGVIEGVDYREYELTLKPGDKLFLYTDGVPEATDKDEKLYGTARMLEALNGAKGKNCAGILENVKKSVSAFVADAPQFDDMTMLCVEYRGPAKNE